MVRAVHVGFVVGFVVGGCDGVFGTGSSPTVDASMCPGDRDCDGVSDAVDNCADLPNSDQRDLERDGIGDACDPCVAKAPSAVLDSDADAIKDSVDLCPGVPDPGQADADGDGVGDACDPDPSSSDVLRCYFDFEDQVLAVTSWELDQAEWYQSASVISHMSEQPPFSAVLAVSGLVPEVRRVAVATSGYATDYTVRPAEYGIGLGGDANALGLRCVVTASVSLGDTIAIIGPDDAVLASQPRTLAGANPRYYVRITAERRTTETAVTCSVRAGMEAPIVVSAVAPALDGLVPVALVARQVAASFFDLTIHQLGP